MKIKSSLIAINLFLLGYSLKSQTIEIPCGVAPVLDGSIDNMEWQNADTVSLSIMNGTNSIDVLVKHDNVNLYLAFLGNLQSATRFPEVLIDVGNDKSNIWGANDGWFHVSATDCENFGAPSVYDSCEVVRPNWTAIPNMMVGSPNVDTIEIEIPFNTLGVQAGDTIGFALDVTNTATLWEFWPSSATINNPSTWGTAVLRTCDPIGMEELLASSFTLYPNPCSDYINISLENGVDNKSGNLRIFDAGGNQVKKLVRLDLANSEEIYVGDLAPGLYHILINIDNDLISKKLIID